MPSSDDEDAPEELTLGQGRDDAESARKQQGENERRLASEEKTRRRKRNELNREAKLKRQMERKANAEETETEELRLASKASGFLDENIVQYLVAKERDQQIPTSVAPEGRTTNKRKHKKESLSGGRIKLLGQDNPSTSRRSTGMDFLKRRLYGSHVVRSKGMIPRPQAD